jgi:hypothetical protein
VNVIYLLIKLNLLYAFAANWFLHKLKEKEKKRIHVTKLQRIKSVLMAENVAKYSDKKDEVACKF